MDHIRERLLKKGVSETAAQIITSTRRKSSESNYNSSWRMWGSWCDKQHVDAFRCDAIKILDYSAFLFGKGCDYRTIGCHKTAISAFHDYVDGKPVGQHPEVCTLVSGIFNNSPHSLQSFTKYLRLTLVFMRNSALREKVNFCFSRVFASVNKMFILAGRLGTTLLFYQGL